MGESPFRSPNNVATFLDNSGASLIERRLGVLSKSDDNGATWTSFAGGILPADTFIQALNSAPSLVNAIELLATLPTGTPGAEVARLLIRMLNAGTLTDAMTLAFVGSASDLYLGASAQSTGLRVFAGPNRVDVLITGTGIIQIVAGTTTFANRIVENRAAGSISVNTLTMAASANVTTVPGTPTINGIVTAGWVAGAGGAIEVAAGSNIVNASGAPGAGAVAILTPTAANIGVTQARIFPVRYNGTNWFVEG